MMNPPVIRHLYRCLVQLHPAEFRREFADDDYLPIIDVRFDDREYVGMTADTLP